MSTRHTEESELVKYLKEREHERQRYSYSFFDDRGGPEEHLHSMESLGTTLNRRIDATNLEFDLVEEEVTSLCGTAYEDDFNSVVIPPHMVATASQYRTKLAETRLLWPKDNMPVVPRFLIKTVVSFPNGWDSVNSKVTAIECALREGADICDVVLNPAKKFTRAGAILELSEIIAKIHWPQKRGIITPIVEVAMFDRDMDAYFHELITGLASIPEVLTIKTATGVNGKTKPSDVEFLANAAFQESSGRVIVKAAGGIGTLEAAQQMIDAGASIIGTSHYYEIMKEWKENEQRNNTSKSKRTK